jgi:aminopeptidase-like protein
MPTDIDAAQKMMDVIAELYPICRSITGNGLRESLRKLHCIVPLQIHEIPTGTSVFDWQVPREWNIREAWIKDSSGRTIVNFRDHSLHIVSYSVPVMKRLSLEALKPISTRCPSIPTGFRTLQAIMMRIGGFASRTDFWRA